MKSSLKEPCLFLELTLSFSIKRELGLVEVHYKLRDKRLQFCVKLSKSESSLI